MGIASLWAGIRRWFERGPQATPDRATAPGGAVPAQAHRPATGFLDPDTFARALIADPEWAAKVRDGRFDALGTYDRGMLATLR